MQSLSDSWTCELHRKKRAQVQATSPGDQKELGEKKGGKRVEEGRVSNEGRIQFFENLDTDSTPHNDS